MKNNFIKHQTLVLLMILSLIFSSCSTNRRLAKEFINEAIRPEVYLSAPEQIYMVSYKPTVKDTTGLTTQQIDSLRFFESDYIQFLEKEKILNAFENGFANQLRKYGYKVNVNKPLPDITNSDSLLTPLSVQYTQLEFEEFIKTITEVGFFNHQQYHKNFYVNAVNLNSWMKIKKNNKEALFFVHDSISDVIDGYFYQKFSGKVKYRYKQYNMSKEDIYLFIEDIAANQAQYFFDYFLNNYIDANRKQGEEREFKYHYDVENNEILLINDLPWIRMKTNQ